MFIARAPFLLTRFISKALLTWINNIKSQYGLVIKSIIKHGMKLRHEDWEWTSIFSTLGQREIADKQTTISNALSLTYWGQDKMAVISQMTL